MTESTNAAIATLCWTAADNFAEETGFFVIEKKALLEIAQVRGPYEIVFHMNNYAKSLDKHLNFTVRELTDKVYEISWQPVDPPAAG